MRLSSFAAHPRFGMDATRKTAAASSSKTEKESATPPSNELPRDQYGRIMPADYFKHCLGTKKSIEDFDREMTDAAKGTALADPEAFYKKRW